MRRQSMPIASGEHTTLLRTPQRAAAFPGAQPPNTPPTFPLERWLSLGRVQARQQGPQRPAVRPRTSNFAQRFFVSRSSPGKLPLLQAVHAVQR